MPRYPLVCPSCGYKYELICSMTGRNEPVACGQCDASAAMQRDYSAPGAAVPRVYHKPIEMYSVAPETPEQLADLREKVPDLEVNDLLVPIARDLPQKNRILKAAGFEDSHG